MNLLPGAGHADDHGFAPALVADSQSGSHGLYVADTLEGIVHTPVGHIDDMRLDVGDILGIQTIRGSELAGELHEKFFPTIEKEYELTCELILEYSDHDALLAGDVTLQRAIMLRNPYVDPMSLMQVDMLERWRKSNYEDQDLFSALLASVNGIAQGLQNTG